LTRTIDPLLLNMFMAAGIPSPADFSVTIEIEVGVAQ
jgi:hypothetical protein